MASQTVRFFFDTYEAAAAGLLTVLLDARETKHFYRFGGLDARSIFNSGLVIEGEILEVMDKLASLPGVIWQNE